MGHDIHREVGPGRWGGVRGFPIERHNLGAEPGTKGMVGIRSAKLEKEGKGPAQALATVTVFFLSFLLFFESYVFV